jgi:hypothetical protein
MSAALNRRAVPTWSAQSKNTAPSAEYSKDSGAFAAVTRGTQAVSTRHKELMPAVISDWQFSSNYPLPTHFPLPAVHPSLSEDIDMKFVIDRITSQVFIPPPWSISPKAVNLTKTK